VIEAVVVMLLVGALSALALLAPLIPVEPVLMAGTLCTGFGLLLGVPTSFWYHVKLRAALLRSERLPERWWMHPVHLHGEIPAAERAGVMLWFYVGGVGFVFTLLGCAGVFLVVLVSFFGNASLA
jgi:hypothetical protein